MPPKITNISIQILYSMFKPIDIKPKHVKHNIN